MPKLVITDNEGSRTLALAREVKAGRLAENEIQLKVPEASRHHCRFFEEKESWFVEDMGSSNGTLVNGRKVSKFELQDGDLISVGAVTMRFLDSAVTAEEKGESPPGWGEDEISLDAELPKEVVEPPPVEIERAETHALDTESAFADPTFALSEVPEKKSPLPSILAILLLLGLAGGLGWLYINRGRLSGDQGHSGGGPVRVASNLVPQKFWSFEPHEIDPSAEEQAGWHKEDAVDSASTGEVQDPVHSGDQAWSISRRDTEKPTAATWVSLSGSAECDISVVAGSTYRLSGWVQPEPGKPIPGLSVTWIEPVAGEEVHEVSREVVPAAPPAGKWTEVSGFVQAPDGASRARVGVVAGGLGDVAFDDVVLEPAEPPAGRSVEVRGFRAWLTSGGALRVFHFARPVSDGIGIWKASEAALEPPWQVFVPRGGPGEGLAGTLRDGGSDLAITLSPAENAFTVKWQLSSAAAGHTILIPLPGGAEEINVTLLEAERARRMRAAFQKASASGVIVGGQGDRMRIRFLDAEGKPFVATLDVVVDSGRPFLKLDRGDRNTIVFQCDLSFDAEMTQARELIARAGEAVTKQKVGEAMTLYEEVLARFPFDETLERQASAALERHANDGRTRIRTLAARVDDAKFFRTARLDDTLLAELQADVERYANTKLQPELKIKHDELVVERTRSAGEKHDAEAKAAYERAQDYLEMKQGRKEVAIAFLEMVVNRYPKTEWAERARELLEKLKSQGASAPTTRNTGQ